MGTAFVDEAATIFPSRNYAPATPHYDRNESNSYLERYDSVLTPQTLILHELSLIKCLFCGKMHTGDSYCVPRHPILN